MGEMESWIKKWDLGFEVCGRCWKPQETWDKQRKKDSSF